MENNRGERQGGPGPVVRSLACLFAALTLALPAASAGSAGEAGRSQELVDQATRTVENFKSWPKAFWSKERQRAHAVFIVPRVVRAGVLLGGGRGQGLLLLRDEKTGEWSEPAFYHLSLVSLLVQAGVDVSEMVLVVHSHGGGRSFHQTTLKLGGDLSVAGGPFGIGTSSASSVTAHGSDILGYSRGKGLYLGLTLAGAYVSIAEKLNQAYYGEQDKPVEILSPGPVRNPGSEALRRAVAETFR